MLCPLHLPRAPSRFWPSSTGIPRRQKNAPKSKRKRNPSTRAVTRTLPKPTKKRTIATRKTRIARENEGGPRAEKTATRRANLTDAKRLLEERIEPPKSARKTKRKRSQPVMTLISTTTMRTTTKTTETRVRTKPTTANPKVPRASEPHCREGPNRKPWRLLPQNEEKPGILNLPRATNRPPGDGIRGGEPHNPDHWRYPKVVLYN
mmetsp:Transcript_5275/g.12570  ORF Transcript_5275/g.12570 Transcript_5275/m.12570 type:complete len:206 (+) Transcript_5275:399-1016(+)